MRVCSAYLVINPFILCVKINHNLDPPSIKTILLSILSSKVSEETIFINPSTFFVVIKFGIFIWNGAIKGLVSLWINCGNLIDRVIL